MPQVTDAKVTLQIAEREDVEEACRHPGLTLFNLVFCSLHVLPVQKRDCSCIASSGVSLFLFRGALTISREGGREPQEETRPWVAVGRAPLNTTGLSWGW